MAIETEIQSEGFSTFLAFHDAKTGERVSLTLHRRAAAALWALLGASQGDTEELGPMTATLRGQIEITKRKAEPHHD